MHPLSIATILFIFCAVVHPTAVAQHHIVNNATSIKHDIVASIDANTFLSSEFKASDGTIIRYRYLAPSTPKEHKRYPLVLQLHGSGGVGTDNVKQLDRLAKTWAMPELREKYQAYIFAPQFPIRSANYGPPTSDQYAVHSNALRAALELTEEFASRHAVDSSKIYAVGFSMGGSAAWLAPTLKAKLFAAVVPISGIAPADTLVSMYKDIPSLVMHGNSDTENPITADRRFTAEVIRSGGKKIRFYEFEGLDHQLSEQIYPGYWWRDWLFEQSRHE